MKHCRAHSFTDCSPTAHAWEERTMVFVCVTCVCVCVCVCLWAYAHVARARKHVEVSMCRLSWCIWAAACRLCALCSAWSCALVQWNISYSPFSLLFLSLGHASYLYIFDVFIIYSHNLISRTLYVSTCIFIFACNFHPSGYMQNNILLSW